jgi:hypothetical protein
MFLDMRIIDMELELESLRDFKDWCVYDTKGFMPQDKWERCDMKRMLDKLGLDDNYSDEVGLDD